jgi:hypothetical protein
MLPPSSGLMYVGSENATASIIIIIIVVVVV